METNKPYPHLELNQTNHPVNSNYKESDSFSGKVDNKYGTGEVINGVLVGKWVFYKDGMAKLKGEFTKSGQMIGEWVTFDDDMDKKSGEINIETSDPSHVERIINFWSAGIDDAPDMIFTAAGREKSGGKWDELYSLNDLPAEYSEYFSSPEGNKIMKSRLEAEAVGNAKDKEQRAIAKTEAEATILSDDEELGKSGWVEGRDINDKPLYTSSAFILLLEDHKRPNSKIGDRYIDLQARVRNDLDNNKTFEIMVSGMRLNAVDPTSGDILNSDFNSYALEWAQDNPNKNPMKNIDSILRAWTSEKEDGTFKEVSQYRFAPTYKPNFENPQGEALRVFIDLMEDKKSYYEDSPVFLADTLELEKESLHESISTDFTKDEKLIISEALLKLGQSEYDSLGIRAEALKVKMYLSEIAKNPGETMYLKLSYDLPWILDNNSMTHVRSSKNKLFNPEELKDGELYRWGDDGEYVEGKIEPESLKQQILDVSNLILDEDFSNKIKNNPSTFLEDVNAEISKTMPENYSNLISTPTPEDKGEMGENWDGRMVRLSSYQSPYFRRNEGNERDERNEMKKLLAGDVADAKAKAKAKKEQSIAGRIGKFFGNSN